jgi:hypothetical protein
MSNTQAKTTALVTNIAAAAVLTLNFIAAATFSASAENNSTGQTAGQSKPSTRTRHQKELDRMYLVTPGYTRPADTDWLCKTAPEFCADYHGSNGG